jgi:hypothetical protein
VPSTSFKKALPGALGVGSKRRNIHVVRAASKSISTPTPRSLNYKVTRLVNQSALTCLEPIATL